MLVLLLLLLLKAVQFVAKQIMWNNSLLVTFPLNASLAFISKLDQASIDAEMSVQNQWKIDGIHDCLSYRCRFAHVSARTKLHKENHSFSCQNVDVHLQQNTQGISKWASTTEDCVCFQLRLFAGSMKEDWEKGHSRLITKWPIRIRKYVT